jgi:MinD superfamily P-loop ATPase
MIIAVASGKGGTGKTTLAVALALASEKPVSLLDCDVEEPNAAIFLKLNNIETSEVTVPVPLIDQNKCTGCGECANICQFNALAVIKSKAMLFPELCHSCGGCVLVCPTGAITEKPMAVGVMEVSEQDGLFFVRGLLTIGRAISPPVIKAVKKLAKPEGITIIDCPPGTSCPMITAVRGSDFIILVTEPTPFGLHDLTLAVETAKQVNIPFGVIVNRSDSGDLRVDDFCLRGKIPVLMKIREDRRIAKAYSNGKPIISAVPELVPKLRTLLKEIGQMVSGAAG